MDDTRPILVWLKAGLIAKLVQTALQAGIWALQKPLLAARNFSDNDGLTGIFQLLVMPLFQAGVFLLIYVLLKQYAERTPQYAGATAPLLLGIFAPITLTLVSAAVNAAVRTLVWWMQSAEQFARLSMIGSYQSWTNILGSFASLCFAACAGMLYWRAKHAPQ